VLRSIATAWLFIASVFANAADYPSDPILRLEIGTPIAITQSIATDAKGRYAVTISNDKTARVWDIDRGHLLSVLRPPIDRNNAGRLFAIAMSPDGETVAAGGFTPGTTDKQMQVFLLSRSTGQVTGHLNTPGYVEALAFSADGKWLAVGCKGGILRVLNWQSDAPDIEPELSDSNLDTKILSMSWSSDNRLVTASSDSTVRLYSVLDGNSSKIAEAAPGSSGKTTAVAFSPSGQEVAVGFDKPHVLILDGRTLRVTYTPNTDGVTAAVLGLEPTLRAVAWSRDGRTLYAAGSWYVPQTGKTPVRSWPNAGRGRFIDLPTMADGVNQLLTLADREGGLLVSPGSAPFGVLRSSGQWRYIRTSKIQGANDRSGRGFATYPTSSDGRKIRMGVLEKPYIFDVEARQLQPDNFTTLSGPRTGDLPVTDWPGQQPRLDGKPLVPPETDYVTSLAIAPDRKSFVMGGVRAIRSWDASGKLLWTTGASTMVDSVNVPSRNDVVVISKDDGTFAWLRLSDGKPILNLYQSPDGRRWVLWSPSGYYDASAGGEDLIGWHINRGAEQAADFFPASKFRARFYRPDIIDQILETVDEGKAIEIANAARGGKPEVQTSVAQTLPPVLELVSPHELSASQGQVSIRYRTRSTDDAPITRVFARVNGLAQPGARRVEVVGADGSHEISVDVPPQDSEIQLFAENRFGASTAALLQVKWAGTPAPRTATMAGAAPGDFQIQPKLYALAIGVSAYENKGIPRLTFAAKDAQDFAQALQRQTGKLYKSVEVKILTDTRANKDDILDALDWLQKQVTQHDVGMLFLSGHGTNDSSLGYVYLPVNSDLNKLKRTAITMTDITTTLNSVAGKAVAFLDTCHSGNIFGPGQKGLNDITGVINELASAENGVVVFSSSTGRQSSLEDASWNNGAFTKALVEGIDGKADEMHTGRVTYKMLDVYVAERVKALTKGKQSPVTQAPGGVNDFPLALAK
jgi:WD40 repeat protein